MATSGGTTSISRGTSSVVLHGEYGIPTLITTGTRLGLSHDRTVLVLQSMNQRKASFVVLRLRDLRVVQTSR